LAGIKVQENFSLSHTRFRGAGKVRLGTTFNKKRKA